MPGMGKAFEKNKVASVIRYSDQKKIPAQWNRGLIEAGTRGVLSKLCS